VPETADQTLKILTINSCEFQLHLLTIIGFQKYINNYILGSQKKGGRKSTA